MPKTDQSGHTQTFWERVDAVLLILLDNPDWILKRRNDDLNLIVREEFEVENVQAGKYIKEAKTLFRKYKVNNIEQHRTKAILDREKVVRLALKQEKLQTALNAMRERDIIKGIYVEKHEHVGKLNVNFGSIPVSSKAVDLSQKLYSEIHESSSKN